MNPPPDKKRRTGDNNDNLWDDEDDDDLLLTQENIDTLMQSQVIGPVSDDKVTVESNPHKPVGAYRTVGRGTIKSRSSSDLVTQPYTAGTSKDGTKFVHTAAGQTSASTEIMQLKAENDKLQKQMIDVQMITQGRIKILQEKLSQKESEIQKMRQDRVDQLNQVVRDQNEMEKCWQSKLEKLKSELQFTKHELNEANQRQTTQALKVIKPKPATQQSVSSDKQGYDFSGDFIVPQKVTASKAKKDAVIQVSLSAVANKLPVPVPDFKLKVKKSKGHISCSYLSHKVLRIQAPFKQLHHKPFVTGSAITDISCKPELESCQTSLETISSSCSSTDSSALSSAYLRLQQANILLMRTLSSLHQTWRHQPKDLLQSDMDSVTLLLPTVAESINTYMMMLSSLSYSGASHSGSMSSTAGSSPSMDTQSSVDSSLPRGFSARCFQFMRQQVYVALRLLKILVTYSIPVRKVLIQQVCPEFAAEQPQDGPPQDNVHLETSGCCLLKRLCHLSNHKLHDGANMSLQLSFLTLDILTRTLQCCPDSHLERLLDNLPITDVILSCVSDHIEDTFSRFRLGCDVLRLLHTLVRSEEVIKKLCTKSDCIFYNVYGFCVQSLNDQPESRSIALQSKFIQILAAVLTADRRTSAILTSVDCNCGEVANQLVSILHHIYLSGCYNDSPRTLALLHQGSCILQNLASLDKDFVQNHETNYQYVEFVYGMDTLYKTLLQANEPVTADLLLELRHDFYGDEEETDDSHDFSRDTSTQSKMMAHETDSFSLNPANHSTPVQADGENRTRKIDETDSKQGKKMKLSTSKHS